MHTRVLVFFQESHNRREVPTFLNPGDRRSEIEGKHIAQKSRGHRAHSWKRILVVENENGVFCIIPFVVSMRTRVLELCGIHVESATNEIAPETAERI